MDRLCLAAWAIAAAGIAAPAWTDSQHQGNVTVRFGWWAFRFDANQQGQSFQRDNMPNSIRFTREGVKP